MSAKSCSTLISFLILLTVVTSVPQVDQKEIDVIDELVAACSQNSHKHTPSELCGIEGIRCHQDCYDLDLSMRNCTNKKLPASVGQLLRCCSFEMQGSKLHGPIPSGFSKLSLGVLNLGNNFLTGSIPSDLLKNSDKKITGLYLSNNNLEGTIPDLGKLKYLKALDLSKNLLSGTIPDLSWFWALTNLNLKSNKLSGTIPVNIYNLINLKELNLQQNKLTGTISSSISYLVNLVFLDMEQNQLTGTIPKEIGSLSSLQEIDFTQNIFTGNIPVEISKLQSLTKLALSSNRLTGSIPQDIDKLANLHELELGNNQLSGSIPKSISKLDKLTSLHLINMPLTGEIPTEIGGLIKLTSLNISGTQISGKIPETIGSLRKIVSLVLRSNKLIDAIPKSIGDLQQLERLDLSHNKITGAIPDEIAKLVKLSHLDLSHNALSGPIPGDLGHLNNIKYIDIQNNQVYGIPLTLNSLRWEEFYFDHNPDLAQNLFTILRFFSQLHAWQLIFTVIVLFMVVHFLTPQKKKKKITTDKSQILSSSSSSTISTISTSTSPSTITTTSTSSTTTSITTNTTTSTITTKTTPSSTSSSSTSNFPDPTRFNRLQLIPRADTYKGIVNLQDFTHTKSCFEYVSDLGAKPGNEKFQFIISECKVWLDSFKSKNFNPYNLTDDEIVAVGLYTWDLGTNGAREKNFYFILNNVLRERNSESVKLWSGYLYYLQSALNKFPSQRIKVYRGIPNVEAVKDSYRTGTKIHWSSYSSSTTELDQAKKFAGDDGVILKIKILNGKDVKEYSAFREENEILLSPNMKFIVSGDFVLKNGCKFIKLVQQADDIVIF